MSAEDKLADECLKDAQGEWEKATKMMVRRARKEGLKDTLFVWACHQKVKDAAARVRTEILGSKGVGQSSDETLLLASRPLDSHDEKGGGTSERLKSLRALSPSLPANHGTDDVGAVGWRLLGRYMGFPLAGGLPLARATFSVLSKEIESRAASARGQMRNARWLKWARARLSDDDSDTVADRWTEKELMAYWQGKDGGKGLQRRETQSRLSQPAASCPA